MAHGEQRDFTIQVKKQFPEYFKRKRVLDVGSYNINGDNTFLFEDCNYTGLDLAPGPNVNVVCPAHEYNVESEFFDTIISTETFEHDMFLSLTLQNIVRLLKSKGLFLFTCATTGRKTHGTKSKHNKNEVDMPNMYIANWDNDYYKNVTEQDVRDVINVDQIFSKYQFIENHKNRRHDLYFWGIKK